MQRYVGANRAADGSAPRDAVPSSVPNAPALPRFWFDAAAIGLLVALSVLAALRKSGNGGRKTEGVA